MSEEKRKRGRPPAGNDTRVRILEAAIELFSKRSYEETGLREIATSAEVDVAYVHRCFGSKQRLFAQAVSAAVKPKELIELDSPEKIPTTMAADLLAPGGTRDIGLKIILNSLANQEAGPIVRDFYTSEAVKPLAETLGVPVMQAAMIAALITGVATLRNLVGLAALSEPQGGELERLLVHLIREIAKGTGTAPKRRTSGKK